MIQSEADPIDPSPLRAERKIGELAAKMEKAKPGGKGGGSRPIDGAVGALSTKASALATAGIAKEDASRYERIAAIPAATFERPVAGLSDEVRRYIDSARTIATDENAPVDVRGRAANVLRELARLATESLGEVNRFAGRVPRRRRS